MVLPSRAIISQKHSIKLLPACLAEEQFSEADLNNFMKKNTIHCSIFHHLSYYYRVSSLSIWLQLSRQKKYHLPLLLGTETDHDSKYVRRSVTT